MSDPHQRPSIPPTVTTAALLEAFVRAGTYLLQGEDFDARVGEALALFGRAAGMDAASLLEFQGAGKASGPADPGGDAPTPASWRVLYAWSPPGAVASYLTGAATGATADLPFAAERLQAGAVVETPLPAPAVSAPVPAPAAEPSRTTHARRGGRTVLASPIYIDGSLWGALLFDTVHAGHPGPDERQVLGATAQAFGLAVCRHQNAERVAAAARTRAAELAAANAALAVRSRLLNVIAEESRALLQAEDLYDAIKHTLCRVGEATGLGRVLYLEERAGGPPGTGEHYGRVRWSAAGEPDDDATWATGVVPDGPLLTFLAPARRGESVWQQVEDLDPAARAAFAPLAVVAVGYAPVFVDGAYVGVVAFGHAATTRSWDTAHMDALTAAANAIGAALQGQRLRERLTRERERAAQTRAAELAQANEVLRRAADGLVAAADLGGVLSVFLREVAAVVETSHAAVLRRVGDGTRFEPIAILDWTPDGTVVLTGEAIGTHPAAAFTRDVTERDETGLFAEVVLGRSVVLPMSELARVLPERAAYLRAHGYDRLWSVPFTLRGAVTGCVNLPLGTGREPDALARDTVAALGSQIALALELTRLAEEAQHAAAARERELAAHERAVALGRANAVLRDGLQRLVGPGDLSAFVGHAVAAAAEQAGAVRADLFRYDPARRALRQMLAVVDGVVFEHGRPDDPPEFRAVLPNGYDEEWPQLVLGGAPALRFSTPPDPRCGPLTADWHRRMGHTGACVLPLAGVHGPLGVLAMAFDRPADIPDVQQELIIALGNQITLALELDRLGEETRRGAVAEERTRIAGELHDTIAQGLAAIVMQLGATRAKLGAAADRAAPELARVERLARSTLADARRAIATIRPAGLTHDGLDAALRYAVDALRDGESDALGGTPPTLPTLDVRGTSVRLPADVELELFRVTQAALTNAVRHAEARAIRVELTFDPAGGVRVVVADDGRGFDAAEPRGERFGLVGMGERAARVGAVLTLVTAPGEGTQVVVNWRPQ